MPSLAGARSLYPRRTLCDAVVSIQDPSTNRQLTMSEHKMIEAMVAQDQPSVEEEFLTAIETCCCRIARPRSNR